MPLRRCACSGQKRYARHIPAPSLVLPPLAPGPLIGAPARARPRSGLRPRFAGRSPRRSPPWLTDSGCRAGPRPPLRRRPRPPAASLRAVLRPGSATGHSPRSLRSPLPAAGGPPARPPLPAGSLCSLGRCPAAGPPRGGPVRVLPSLVPRSVGRLAGLRAPGLPPGPPAGLCPAAPALRPGRWGFRRLRAAGEQVCAAGPQAVSERNRAQPGS